MYLPILRQMKKQLAHIDAWLDKATAFAKTKNFDPNVLLEARLAPDQFAFTRQVQIACDTLKLGTARLTGKEAPSHADKEKTVDELRARVKDTLTWLDGFSEKDFADASGRVISLPYWEGRSLTGESYFLEHVVPNFYFHLTTVYDILRHNGVDVGKRDFLGQLSWRA